MWSSIMSEKITFQSVDEFMVAVKKLEADYENAFGEPIPSKILGWWDPLHLHTYSMTELATAYARMAHDVQAAITTMHPIMPVSDKLWDMTIF